MIPYTCRVKHDPPNSYGDCLRVSVASMLDINPPEIVPHFYEDGCDAVEGMERFRSFLRARGYVPFWNHFPAHATVDQVLETMENTNPGVYYLLFGRTYEEIDHVVICRGKKIEHDSAWRSTKLIGAGSNGHWNVCVFVPTLLA